MSKEIIINTNSRETRIALLENNHLAEIYIERENRKRIVGNVYRGIVTKVLPGMQAAFIDIGLDKDAFLYVLDVFDNFEDYENYMIIDSEELNGLEEIPRVMRNQLNHITASIEELLQEGQEVLVQVSKEPIGSKGARVTSHIALPGRNLVYMPTVDHIGISKRIRDPVERERLKRLISQIKTDGTGYIVRTVGEDRTEEEFRDDMEILQKLWENILKESEKTIPPSIIHSDLDPISRAIRDLFTPEIDRIVIDSEIEYEKCLEHVDKLQPHLTQRIKLHLKREPIFDTYHIEDEIEKALQNKVWLKSGGYIVIDQAEALVAIDVNTGKFVGKTSLEETIVKTNLEASKEIVRQLRIRDLGGIIVIDFIDMEKEENKEKVLSVLEQALFNDRSRTKILGINELGLVEMTRKRVRQSLKKILCQGCPYCKGSGMIKSTSTICYEIHNEIARLASYMEEGELLVRANPEVVETLLNEERFMLQELEQALRKRIVVQEDEKLHIEQFDIVKF